MKWQRFPADVVLEGVRKAAAGPLPLSLAPACQFEPAIMLVTMTHAFVAGQLGVAMGCRVVASRLLDDSVMIVGDAEFARLIDQLRDAEQYGLISLPVAEQ